MLTPAEFDQKAAEFMAELENARASAHRELDARFDVLKFNGVAHLAMLERDIEHPSEH